MAVFSMKIDQARYDAFTLLAESQGTTKNALLIEAVDAILAGGIQKALDDRIKACLGDLIGAESIESRLREIIKEEMPVQAQDTNAGNAPQDCRCTLIYIPPENKNQEVDQKVDLKPALIKLEALLEKGDVALDDLATELGADKSLLSRSLSAIGIKTERKRVGGQRKQIYAQALLDIVRKAKGELI